MDATVSRLQQYRPETGASQGDMTDAAYVDFISAVSLDAPCTPLNAPLGSKAKCRDDYHLLSLRPACHQRDRHALSLPRYVTHRTVAPARRENIQFSSLRTVFR